MDLINDIRGIDVNDTDFSIATRMPGARVYTPLMGLALAMTLVGSALQEPVPAHLLFIGEVDLRRQIRDVPDVLAAEVGAAVAAGAIERPVKVVCSPGTASLTPPPAPFPAPPAGRWTIARLSSGRTCAERRKDGNDQ